MKNSISEKIEKGLSLLNESLENYKKGDYTKANNLRINGNCILDEVQSLMKTQKGKDIMLYGDDNNFGIIYSVFEGNTDKLMECNQKGLVKILNIIKGNNVLLNEFIVYNAITHPENVSDATLYINEVFDIIPKYSKKEFTDANSKLIEAIRKEKLNEFIDIPEDDIKIFDCINSIMMNEKKLGNIKNFVDNKKFLAEHVEKINVNTTKNNINDLYKDKIDEIKSKYDLLLNNNEKKFIQEITNPNVDKKLLFEDLKSNIISIVNKKISNDSEYTEQWLNILENVKNKVYNEADSLPLIAEMIEIKDTINE